MVADAESGISGVGASKPVFHAQAPPRRGFWGTILPDGLGRKAILVGMLVAGWIALTIVAVVMAFQRFEFEQAMQVVTVLALPLATTASALIGTFVGGNIATNGKR